MKTRLEHLLGVLLLAAALAGCEAGQLPDPSRFDATHLSSGGVDADLALQSESAASYCALVTLRNTGASAVTGWSLVVELNQATLNQVSGATARQSAATQFTATPAAGNATLAPGESASFGFCAATPSGPSRPGLAYFSVEGSGASPAPSPTPSPTPRPSPGPNQRTLTVTVSGSGTTTPEIGTHPYEAGASVQITARPATGSTFLGWSGDATGSDNPVTVTMDADKAVAARFSPSTPGTRYTLTIAASGNGTGTIDPAPGAHSYDAGTSVTLKATPGASSTFAGWSGDAAGTASPVTIRMDGDRSVTATFSGARPTTFANPVLWEDLADIDILRVGDTFYYMASNMHYSPGAPILRSYDLVNWEYAGHAVPVLDFGAAFDLNGGQAYIKGTWASFFNYRKSNKTFYFGGLINGGGDLMYTATSVEGPWVKHQIKGGSGYYDAGLLIDDDDTMYVAYGISNISVAQLAADGFSQVKKQVVYSDTEYIEGSRFYKRDGNYYILVTQPASTEYVLRSTSGPFGPYEKRTLVKFVPPPVSGAGNPHQGGLVETQNGDWYYMGFIDAYPGGRSPVLAPIQWSADGWPTVQLVNGTWSASYPFPDVPPAPRAVKPSTGVDTFSGAKLGHEWEWNHNPDNTKWSAGEGLKLQAATVTADLYRARNTLTRRIRGPSSTATIVLDYAGMKDGDRAGLVILRHTSAWVGVRRDGGATRVSMVNGLAMDGSWNTKSTGSEVASAEVSGGRIWLRAAADIRPGTGRQVRFSYSTDGTTFTPIGNAFTMDNAWQFFMGYRFGIFNYATQALGGAVTVKSFELATP